MVNLCSTKVQKQFIGEEDTLFFLKQKQKQMALGRFDIYVPKINLGPYLTPYTKMNSNAS